MRDVPLRQIVDHNLDGYGQSNPLPVALVGGLSGGNTARIDDGNSTQAPLANGSTFTGAWGETTGLAALTFLVLTSGPLSTAKIQWSSDGVSANTDLLAEVDFLSSETLIDGYYNYSPDPQTVLINRYYRVVLTNTSGSAHTVTSGYMWTFPLGSEPLQFESGGGLNVNVSRVSLDGGLPIAPLTTWTSRTLSVTATAVEVTGASPLAARKTITLKADSNNAAPIYLGPTNAVDSTCASLAAGEALTLEIDGTTGIWVVVDNGSEDLDVVEVA